MKRVNFLKEEDKENERLFKRPKVHQFFLDKVLVRSSEERKASFNELYFDLIFVAIISEMGRLFSASLFTFDSFLLIAILTRINMKSSPPT